MLTPDLFEDLLATYPAEKRELARQVYCRFAEGDSTQFFTQLFLVLDIYAHYAERVPQAAIEANRNAHASLARVQEQIGMLAQTIDRRNLNITNHAEKTDELCQEAVAKCNETITRFEMLLKNIGTQVDIKAIVDGLQKGLESGINKEIIAPFVSRSEELAKQVIPTLANIRQTSAEAAKLWPGRIWKTALISSGTLAVALSLLGTGAAYQKFQRDYDHKVAEEIVRVEQLLNYNQDAFRQLAIAQVPIKVMRTESHGVLNPRTFALVIEGADSVEMRQVEGQTNGLIFFTSDRMEKQIQHIHMEVRRLTEEMKPKSK